MNKERLERIKKAYGHPLKDGNYPDEMIAEIEKCWDITELAVKALEWYADEETYESLAEWSPDGELINVAHPPINDDNGKQAQSALDEIKRRVRVNDSMEESRPQ